MQMAIDVAGFTPAESDELRQAMGSKRSAARMERLRERLYAGMAERGITGDIADELFVKMKAFANYGFPESHSVSFAYLVYASSWIKYHEPAAFCAALLNAQPMGFWSPHTLVRDARRHGVVVRTPDLNASLATATLEPSEHPVPSEYGMPARPASGTRTARDTRMGALAGREWGSSRRCGWGSGRCAGSATSWRRRSTPPGPPTGRSATSRTSCGGSRRSTCASSRRWRRPGCSGSASGWSGARRCGRSAPSRSRAPTAWPASSPAPPPPGCPGMSPVEEAVADLWATGVSPDGHPTTFLRQQLTRARRSSRRRVCGTSRPAPRVTVAGVVTHRQRPMTAQGTTFLNLEDETGLINVVVSKGCWARFRRVAREAPAMTIRGRMERSEGVINVVAEHLEPLTLPGSTIHASRDFR